MVNLEDADAAAVGHVAEAAGLLHPLADAPEQTCDKGAKVEENCATRGRKQESCPTPTVHQLPVPTTEPPSVAPYCPAEHCNILGKRYWLVRVRGDGNFLFHCMSKFLHDVSDEGHMELRRTACRWLIAN